MGSLAATVVALWNTRHIPRHHQTIRWCLTCMRQVRRAQTTVGGP
jgi:hypothetical protein